jgi:glycosidase
VRRRGACEHGAEIAMRKLTVAAAALLACLGAAARAEPAAGASALAAPPATQVAHVAWSRNAVLYEVNLRQYAAERPLAALERDLPRLKALGVDILWLMPLQPIGIANRKGPLGSYYAIRDYTAVNPEFGTLAEVRQLVRAIHAAGLHVILDWVANHTAWDHPWLAAHPDWYQKDARGEIVSYEYDNGKQVDHWTDVVGLDYRAAGLRAAMLEAMRFWIAEVGFDGLRCDVAGRVPVSFWDEARAALERVKPVFMLAEADAPALLERAFDMDYDWDFAHLLQQLARGAADARALVQHLEQIERRFPAGSYQMLFTSNHDFNSWDGSDAELYGPAFDALVVLTMTLPGMPLIYNGQEAGLDRRLAFFDKDPIDWHHRDRSAFFGGLARRKHRNPALAAGAAGGALEWLAVDDPAVLSFRRRRGANVVTVTVNLSGAPRAVRLPGAAAAATLAPWGYRIDERH